MRLPFLFNLDSRLRYAEPVRLPDDPVAAAEAGEASSGHHRLERHHQHNRSRRLVHRSNRT